MSAFIRNLSIATVACMALLAVLGFSRVIVLKPKSVEVVATVAVSLPDGSGKTIDMPDAKVTLLDSTGVTVGNAASDINGQFRIVAPSTGIYSLCWDIQGR